MQIKVHLNDFLLPLLGNRIAQAAGITKCSYNVVCLNSPSLPNELLPRLWPHSNLKVCADGGANCLFKGLSAEDRQACIPNFIVGDLDSLEASVKEYYQARGTTVVHESEQETNDLDKSLRLLSSELSKQSGSAASSSVLVLGAFGGRFDQEMANVHALYAWKNTFHRLILVDNNSTAILLDPEHSHRIVPMSSRGNPSLCEDSKHRVEEGRYCGLLPLTQPVRSVSTTGLQWNLTSEPLEFGIRISTSNTIPVTSQGANEVTVRTSEPLLWSSSYDLIEEDATSA